MIALQRNLVKRKELRNRQVGWAMDSVRYGYGHPTALAQCQAAFGTCRYSSIVGGARRAPASLIGGKKRN